MLFINILAATVLSACSDIKVRKEWRQLTKTEQQAYLNAVQKLYAQAKTSEDPNTWNSMQFGQYHFDTYDANHSVKDKTYQPTLLPWHRVFIQKYENALRKIDPSVVLPYWDCNNFLTTGTIGYQTPLQNEVLQAFGNQADPSTGCLSNGVAAGWKDHQGNCIKRFSTNGAFWNPQSVVDIVEKNTNYQTFQTQLEFGPHPVVHMTVGGVGGQFSSSLSANEPIFFLHHAMVDKIWQMWQGCAGMDGQYAGSTSTVLNPFGTAVRDTFSTTGGEFCYTYSKSPIDSTVKIQCKSDWLQGWVRALIPAVGNTTAPVSNAAKFMLEDSINIS